MVALPPNPGTANDHDRDRLEGTAVTEDQLTRADALRVDKLGRHDSRDSVSSWDLVCYEEQYNASERLRWPRRRQSHS